MSAVLDEDVLATLTDEEREAIESGDLSESEREALKAIAGQDDEEDEDGDDTPAAPPVEGKGAADALDDEPGAAAEGDHDGQASADDAEEGERRTFRPAYKAELPEDFDQQVASLDSQIDDLAQRFKGGEIDFDQYRAESKDIEAKRAELNGAKLRSDLYSDMTAQNAEQEWNWTVNRFMRTTAKAGDIDYAQDEAKRNDLDGFVKALAKVEANANKDFDWFLAEAHKRVKALHGIAAPKPGGGEPPPSRRSPVDAAPITLANVPGSDGPGDLAGEFADLDGLDGDALELAIAKMTPEQREKYARGT